ncbi:MAG: peptide chain release factor N(5)-glutamine methyltransferase [Flavobacterium sp.]|nr:peptide chain release factor N(5)-glutamine methyltransferase [Flavobacterium sp.]
MLIRDFRNYFISQLESVYDQMEVEQFFNLALSHHKNLSRIDLALNPSLEFSQDEQALFNDIITKLKAHIPIQYILGRTSFYGAEFLVTNAVLIPRPETEELVQWVIESSSDRQLRILDIGTGSGCIAITLARNIRDSVVEAWDVSATALSIATKNAEINKVSVEFTLVDVLAVESPERKYTVIVSNPPYVRNLEKQEIANNVLDYEPHLALFVEDDDPLIFYRKIATLATRMLKPNGLLFFEINQYLGAETVALLERLGFKDIELRKDIYNNDRMIKCRYS